MLTRVGHWSPQRWAKPACDGSRSRAECVFALVQQLADAAAVVEGRPVRPVPRLDNDLALPDQLRVMIADLLAAESSSGALDDAIALLEANARLL